MAAANMNGSFQDRIAKERKFEESLSEAIDEALTQLGEPIKNALYLQLEDRLNIQRSEIPHHIKEFSDFLSTTFGLGAARFEIKCMKKLHSKINVRIQMTEDNFSIDKWVDDGLTFEYYINRARDNYCNPH
ncbi:MAG: hypothetical protein ABSF65_03010 [Candidatus Bathyarchaeia archaeon]